MPVEYTPVVDIVAMTMERSQPLVATLAQEAEEIVLGLLDEGLLVSPETCQWGNRRSPDSCSRQAIINKPYCLLHLES